MGKSEALTRIDSVVVVDDSAVQRDYAVGLCRVMGIPAIYEASGGREALDLLDMLILPPSALIIDLEMPGMDGVELLEQFRARRVEVPIILASSREQPLIDSVQLMGVNVGLRVVAGVQKPLTATTLRRALAQCEAHDATAPAPRTARMPITTEALITAIDEGQIDVHYQPKVDIRTGIVRGVEALARWRHPVMGAVPPDQFVALAEREGLIGALTTCVMEQAFAQAGHWNTRGLNISLALNLSPKLLAQANIVQEVAALAENHALAPSQVILEITESSLVANLGAALSVLARLRLKGFGLSIDDFGTGFSSMQQLARIPFTELKVDRYFVHGAHRRKTERVILRLALETARQLELVSVAEGVETMEDWKMLQEFGCTIGQGWLIAKAMPGDALLPWMKSNRARLDALRTGS